MVCRHLKEYHETNFWQFKMLPWYLDLFKIYLRFCFWLSILPQIGMSLKTNFYVIKWTFNCRIIFYNLFEECMQVCRLIFAKMCKLGQFEFAYPQKSLPKSLTLWPYLMTHKPYFQWARSLKIWLLAYNRCKLVIWKIGS